MSLVVCRSSRASFSSRYSLYLHIFIPGIYCAGGGVSLVLDRSRRAPSAFRTAFFASTVLSSTCRGTSLMRNSAFLGPYSRIPLGPYSRKEEKSVLGLPKRALCRQHVVHLSSTCPPYRRTSLIRNCPPPRFAVQS